MTQVILTFRSDTDAQEFVDYFNKYKALGAGVSGQESEILGMSANDASTAAILGEPNPKLNLTYARVEMERLDNDEPSKRWFHVYLGKELKKTFNDEGKAHDYILAQGWRERSVFDRSTI